jgi:L-lactate dehydrogenase complex protein LldG
MALSLLDAELARRSATSFRDLVVQLDPKHIVANIHDEYEYRHFKLRPYSVLMTGPPGSGDIGGVVVHPAQGVKSLTVLLAPAPEAG